jgi:GDP-mannose 6-dehydrogenase
MTTLSVFGIGYVGSVTAACLAHKGNRVIGVDINASKVELLDSGRTPVLEHGLDEVIAECHRAGRLRATTDAAEAVKQSDVSVICVGTPGQRNGKLDLSHVQRACEEIGQALQRKDTFHLVVLRSTVLPGTTESVVSPALEKASKKRAGVDFAVSYNPEFLREGSALADFFHPTITVFGGNEPLHLAPLRQIYDWVPGKVFETSLSTAEMVKYVSNAFHGLKVSFANEVGTLCKRLGVDAQAVTEIFMADTSLNISSAYLFPGFAFGGSCLPKDVRALTYRAKELDLRLPLFEAILPSNNEHIERAFEAILRTNRKKVGILGLSFKAGTDDLRESPIVQLIKRLIGEGLQIEIWDRDVSLGRLVGSNRQFIEEVIPHIGSLLCPDARQVIEKAEVVVIGTNAVDRETLAACMTRQHLIIDLVNIDRSRRPEGLARYDGICW